MHDITIFHLYPEHLNLYGDRGNLLALVQRSRWHGLKAHVVPVRPGSRVNFNTCDLLIMGGGQDNEQRMVVEDLQNRYGELKEAVEAGMVLLAICGSYQLLGRYYADASGERIPGLNLLDFYTSAGERRLIGNIVTSCSLWDPPQTLVGFENHSGRTFLGQNLKPLGKVIKGYGNNAQDRTEGVCYKNVIGTYLHGALLPKNPWLTDYLIKKTLQYRKINFELKTLDDSLETEAHKNIIKQQRYSFFKQSPYYHIKES